MCFVFVLMLFFVFCFLLVFVFCFLFSLFSLRPVFARRPTSIRLEHVVSLFFGSWKSLMASDFFSLAYSLPFEALLMMGYRMTLRGVFLFLYSAMQIDPITGYEINPITGYSYHEAEPH